MTRLESSSSKGMVDGVPISLIVAAVVLFPEVVSLVASILQRSWIGKPVPKELEGIYDPEEYATSNQYTKAKSTYGLFKDVFDLAVFFAFWFLGGFPWLDSVCVGFGFGEVVTGLLYIGFMTVASTVLSLPWDYYSTFVLEESFGFNKTTRSTFVKDRTKALALTVALGGPLLAAILWFFTATGTHGWLYVWATLTVFQVVLLFLAPVLIMPIFISMLPLPQGLSLITGDMGKESSLSFLTTRVMYEDEKQSNGKPCWVTKDSRFQPGEPGHQLCIRWSEGDAAWVIAEGAEDSGGAVYAIGSQAAAPGAGSSLSWTLTEAAKSLAAEKKGASTSASQPLVENSVTTKCVDVGSLRSKLLALAERLGYTGANIFVIDGSTRSEHSNAFCTGFGRFRRICLFDTLLPLMEEAEIIAVLGHEIGHDRLYHVHTGLVFGIFYSFVMFYAMGQFLHAQWVASAFFVPEPKVYLGLILFSVVWGIVDFFVSIPLTVNSRMNEFAADRYSIDADPTYAGHLAAGLKKLTRKSKANLTPHPLYVFLKYSHPPLDTRVKAMEEYRQKKYG
eukprot:TRINITY_DN74692_c0_g1_i1.p1 TRINITY_DN74692_c0_g1~~TRINITY_DN74692_c0_g1_i1.p1  ORF type:complete len:582 (+),score=111.41 TRINITY_DN74692_c0_g1_i1:63-1748(+)